MRKTDIHRLYYHFTENHNDALCHDSYSNQRLRKYGPKVWVKCSETVDKHMNLNSDASKTCYTLTKKNVCESHFVKNVLQTEPMRVVYRMRGLLGDATEDMVNTLDSGKGV